ncbi:hypothetical protein ACHAXA_004313 [Cyclostephanos tholiformis]|uniref:CAAX prenyl protease 2/Lysostaphin resistance protein A-like domain-containing protein n=1 Tax=Cyclostephanos tholiformis TaxID=382380 RepID=A0ABD3SPF0_9STRA
MPIIKATNHRFVRDVSVTVASTRNSHRENRPVYTSRTSTNPSLLVSSASASCNDGSISSDAERSPSARPNWALPWMPTWLITLRPRTQFLIGLCLYVFHLRILTQHQLTFPFQLIPNDEGWFQSIGLDSLAGMMAFGGLVWLRKSSVEHTSSSTGNSSIVAVPPIWADPTMSEAPWKLRSKAKKAKKRAKKSEDDIVEKELHPRSTSIIAFLLLTVGYFSTGRFSLLFENTLYAAAGSGLPLTVPMHRSLVVLLGHLAWVIVGSAILAVVLSPKPFFGGGWTTALKKDDSIDNESKTRVLRSHRWYTNKWDTYWIWWTIGGYFVSAWLFNIADFVNQIVLPPYLFAQQAEGVVSQLINPENNDFLASLVGYIAPCLSAPWWEEVLYRGYLLPALGLFMGFWPSVFVSGILFSVHHMNVMGAIPLMVLGWLWAALYAKSGNLLVTMLIHGMWNSRVFLGSWLGL